MLKIPRLVTIFVLTCGLVTAWVFHMRNRQETISPPGPPTVDSDRLRPPGESGKPHIGVSPDGRLVRIRHKDASGLSPLEIIPSRDGEITIQRTFANDGTLLKEEATQNGITIPLPSE